MDRLRTQLNSLPTHARHHVLAILQYANTHGWRVRDIKTKKRGPDLAISVQFDQGTVDFAVEAGASGRP